MKATAIWTLVAVLAVPALEEGVCQNEVRILEKTYTGEIVEGPNWARTETFGFAAEAFIPNCEIWLLGEWVEPVRSPDGGGEYGVFIEKKADRVTVNGRTFMSLQDTTIHWAKDRSVPLSELPFEDYAAETFRLESIQHDKIEGAYVIRGQVFLPGVPKAFMVEEKGDSIIVTVEPKFRGKTDYMLVEHEGAKSNWSLYKGPRPKAAQRNEQSLTACFEGLVKFCRPGGIVIEGFGYAQTYPLAEKEALVEALKQIPDLAVPDKPEPDGRPRYEPLEIHGYLFISPLIADFVNSYRRRGDQ